MKEELLKLSTSELLEMLLQNIQNFETNVPILQIHKTNKESNLYNLVSS